MMFKPGDKVTYITDYKVEHGIIKSLSNPGFAHVVYNCGDEWEDYQNYTAARTKIKDLVAGWVGKPSIGLRVKLKADEEEGWLEQKATILGVEPNCLTVEIDEEYRRDKFDDGLREVGFDQIDSI